MRSTLHALAALLVAMSLSGAAGAQARADSAAAETLFREGRAAADAGNHEKACKKFAESNRLDPAPGTLFNLADCEEKLGHVATAWTLFREVAQKLPASDERTRIAVARATALEPRLPKLSIRAAPNAPAATRVFRDGVELKSGSLDTALPIDPGTHVLAIEAKGHARAERVVSIVEGDVREETLEPGPALPPGAGDGDASSGSSTGRTVGWVLGGVGLVGVGVGVVTGLMVLGKKSTVDEQCDSDKQCTAEGADAADAGRTLGPISTVGFVVGGIALATGAVLVFTVGDSPKTSGGRAGPRTTLGLGLGRVEARHTF